MTVHASRPIVIADYDPRWPRMFEAERAAILRVAPEAFVALEHAGSTSVPRLAAKPIIDVLGGVRDIDAFGAHIAALESIGWEYAPEAERDQPGVGAGTPFRRYFRKTREDGERWGHLHVVELDTDWFRDTLLFRDWLRAHPEDVRRYEELKRRLADDYNRDALPLGININPGYTDRKSDFVAEVLAKARTEARQSA
jgi:GrpB-like predicted nucleotidyltransferase (UPF0157 family)